MSDTRRWRVQAFWTVNGQTRSYAPNFADSEAEANRLCDDIRSTLWHFVGLDIRVDRVEADEANAVERELERRRAAAPKPLIHILVAGRKTLCGVAIDRENAAAAPAFLSLSNGDKCRECTARAGLTG